MQFIVHFRNGFSVQDGKHINNQIIADEIKEALMHGESVTCSEDFSVQVIFEDETHPVERDE